MIINGVLTDCNYSDDFFDAFSYTGAHAIVYKDKAGEVHTNIDGWDRYYKDWYNVANNTFAILFLTSGTFTCKNPRYFSNVDALLVAGGGAGGSGGGGGSGYAKYIPSENFTNTVTIQVGKGAATHESQGGSTTIQGDTLKSQLVTVVGGKSGDSYSGGDGMAGGGAGCSFDTPTSDYPDMNYGGKGGTTYGITEDYNYVINGFSYIPSSLGVGGQGDFEAFQNNGISAFNETYNHRAFITDLGEFAVFGGGGISKGRGKPNYASIGQDGLTEVYHKAQTQDEYEHLIEIWGGITETVQANVIPMFSAPLPGQTKVTFNGYRFFGTGGNGGEITIEAPGEEGWFYAISAKEAGLDGVVAIYTHIE